MSQNAHFRRIVVRTDLFTSSLILFFQFFFSLISSQYRLFVTAYAKSMIEKTSASGYMARHCLHWAKPDNPTYDEFFSRILNVDEQKKDRFLKKVTNLWKDRGQKGMQPNVITK